MIKITPIGGQNQIGQNCWQFETKDTTFLIDCGILFPNDNYFNINCLAPDVNRLNNPKFLIITHGHEDHIGAIPFLLKKFPDIKIYAPALAYELIQYKLQDHKIRAKLEKYHGKITFKGVTVTPIRVNHSIPNSYGLFLEFNECPYGIFYVSDFKIDDSKLYEPEFDFALLKNLAKKYQQKLLMADSTNILVDGETGRESDLIERAKILLKPSQRIFVTSFASNVYRVQTIVNVCKQYKKTVVPYGRSMQKFVQLATKLGYLKDYGIIRDVSKVNPTSTNLVVLLSGCQGEELGALNRIANGRDSNFKINGKDVLIFSSRTIPGNEVGVEKIINKLCVVSPYLHFDLHVSGHPAKEDLKKLYKAFKPTDIVPIHGNKFFLLKHTELAKSWNNRVVTHILHNGDELTVAGQVKSKKGKTTRPVLLSGNKNIEIDHKVMLEKKDLAYYGVIFISMNKQYNLGVKGLGLPSKLNLRNLEDFVLKNIKNPKLKKLVDNYCYKILGYSPVIVISVI